MSFSKIINHNQLLFNIFEPSINGKRIVKPRYNPPKSGSKSIVLGDYKHILEGKGYSKWKRRYPKRNNGNHVRSNLESPAKRGELKGDYTIPVVYTEIHVQPCVISGGKYLVGLKIPFYLCR